MSEAADKFEKRIVARWGAPATVMADNVFKGKLDSWQELIPIILFIIDVTPKRFVQHSVVPFGQSVFIAMNTSNAKAHKKSPYYAVTGRESVMPGAHEKK